MPPHEPRGYPDWPPDLAAEVLDQNDHPAYTLEKIAQWLRAGVRPVWVFDCECRVARVYRANGTETLLGPDGVLEGEDVLPGFRCSLSEIFL